MDGGHDRAAHARHKADAGKDHEQGHEDIDGRDAVGAHAMPHEDAVHGGDGRNAEHS